MVELNSQSKEKDKEDLKIQEQGSSKAPANSNQQAITGTFQPKYIWKYTKLDGQLPIANFTSEVKLAQEKKGNNLVVIKKPTPTVSASDLCKITNFDQLSSDEEEDED